MHLKIVIIRIHGLQHFGKHVLGRLGRKADTTTTDIYPALSLTSPLAGSIYAFIKIHEGN